MGEQTGGQNKSTSVVKDDIRQNEKASSLDITISNLRYTADAEILQITSNPVDMEILKTLLVAGRLLRPTEIQAMLPQSVRPYSSTKLYYHIAKLQRANLVFNDRKSHKLSLYGLTDSGRKLILQPLSKEAQAAYLASLISRAISKPENEIRDVILDWLK